MNQLSFVLCMLLVLSASVVLADHPTQHYRVKKPTSVADALSLLQKGIADSEQILSSNDVSPKMLEKIHELSYSLEGAAEFLAQQQGPSNKLTELQHSIEELHRNSEQRKEEETRRALYRLKSAFLGGTNENP